MTKIADLNDVQPKAVMTEDELKAWEALPAAEQLKRLRAAIDKGSTSGTSGKTMDEVWEAALARTPNARV